MRDRSADDDLAPVAIGLVAGVLMVVGALLCLIAFVLASEGHGRPGPHDRDVYKVGFYVLPALTLVAAISGWRLRWARIRPAFACVVVSTLSASAFFVMPS